MATLLNQPYPTEASTARNLAKSVGIGAFVGLFLLVFQPFGLEGWQTSAKPLKIIGFGGVALVVMLANFLLLPALWPNYFSDKCWTVGKEIGRIMAVVLVIAICNRLYLGWLLNAPVSMGGWLWAVGVTLSIGIFPAVGSVVIDYIIRLRRYSQVAGALPIHAPVLQPTQTADGMNDRPDASSDSTVTLIADNEKDTLTLLSRDLLFIESSDNYCTVVYLKNGQVAKPLLRSSLSRLEKQIDRAHIVRCHRSFVVNLDRVERVTGNAQGYKLHLSNGQFQIPVSRQNNEQIIAGLKGL